jgi:hypothetical protein
MWLVEQWGRFRRWRNDRWRKRMGYRVINGYWVPREQWDPRWRQ